MSDNGEEEVKVQEPKAVQPKAQPKIKKKKKIKPPRVRRPKAPGGGGGGGGRTAVAVIALLLALASLGGGGYYVYTERQATAQASAAAKEAEDAFNKRLAALEEAASVEKNKESVVLQMEPHSLAAYMADSAYLYQTRFSDVRFAAAAETQALVKLRVPVTVTVHNNSDQTITVESAALYPWETIFDETARQETLAAQQAKGFFGEVVQGQRDGFSVAPGESVSIEIDAMLRGVYGHPALEAETHRFFMDYFGNPAQAAPDPDADIIAEGKGAMNGQLNYLFCDALNFYCTQRNTRFTLTYSIKTGRGNAFSATCTVAF